MKQPLLYSACWPNLLYSYYLVNFPGITVERFDTYERQTYRNRYEILTANGVQSLSVPVLRKTHNAKMQEVEISYAERWQHRHWRTITSAYGRSAFFEFFEDELRRFYTVRTASLLQYNLDQIGALERMLRLQFTVELTDEFVKQPAGLTDLRHYVRPGTQKELPENMPVLTQRYFQTFSLRHGFIPNLSVLDLLLNTGLNTVEYLSGKSL